MEDLGAARSLFAPDPVTMPARLFDMLSPTAAIQDGIAHRWRAYGFQLVGTLTLVTAAVGTAGTIWLYQSERNVERAQQLATSLKTVLALETDAETGQRGFLITGRDAYLQPYERALAAIPGELLGIDALVQGEPVQMQRLAELRRLLALKQEELAHVIEVRRASGFSAAQEEVSDDRGKRLMDQARGIVDAMSNAAVSGLGLRQHYATVVRDFAVIAGVCSASLTIALLICVAASQRRIDRVRADAARTTHAQKDLLHTTISNIGEGVLATGADGRVLFINQAGQKLLQLPQSLAEGRPIERVLGLRGGDNSNHVEDPVSLAMRERRTVALPDHTVLVLRDGTEIFIELECAPIIDARAAIRGTVIAFRDVTSRKRAEAELNDRDRRKSEFIATLSHELRNPLASVRNALEVMLRLSGTDSPLELQLRVIDRHLRHMGRMIDDLLVVSRLTQDTLNLQLSVFDVRYAVDDAIEVVAPAIHSKRQRLVLRFPDDTLHVLGDRLRLSQVFANLLTNASKYSPEGSAIIVAAQSEGADVVVRVEDVGRGLTAGDAARIFNWFVQVEPAEGELNEGLGVGLAIARRIVLLHGGTLEARSEGPGRGSAFVTRLRKQTFAFDEAPPKDIIDSAVGDDIGPVLVADDNSDAADGLATVLRLNGFDVATAYDGLSAYRKACQLTPQVLLLDIGMPGMSGYELARAVRATPWGTRARLIAVTGWGQDEDKQRAFDAGFDLHFTKPADFSAIEKALADFAAERRTAG